MPGSDNQLTGLLAQSALSLIGTVLETPEQGVRSPPVSLLWPTVDSVLNSSQIYKYVLIAARDHATQNNLKVHTKSDLVQHSISQLKILT